MTGDQNDVFLRLKLVIPRWFGSDSTIFDGVLQGLAWLGSFIYSLYEYAKLQTRIKTATGGWLDLIAFDFFGERIRRKANQSDQSFLNTILINLIRERCTRNSIIKILEDLTGRTPRLFEPLRPADTGGYGLGGCGFSVAGGYGSFHCGPCNGFVDAYRPLGTGIPLIAGYGISTGGYGQASRACWASEDMIQATVTDAEIYAAVDSVKMAGTEVWVRINN